MEPAEGFEPRASDYKTNYSSAQQACINAGSEVPLLFAARVNPTFVLEYRPDCHRMTVTQIEVFLEPSDKLARFHFRAEDTGLFSQRPQILRGLSGLGFYVIQIGLK
jgi:hypothetical protein